MTLVQRETATPEDCALALRQLSDADLRRLDESARLRAAGLASVDGRDLLNEAIVRMLTGKRRWPTEVPLTVFLRETMRSIASDYWRRRAAAVVVAESDIRADVGTGDGVVATAADSSMEPEARTAAAEALARIEEQFKKDGDALAVISGKVQGKSPAEIQEENAMSKKRYATTQRRIRRGLVRLFGDGSPLA